MNDKVNSAPREFNVELLAVLERIAVALEKGPTFKWDVYKGITEESIAHTPVSASSKTPPAPAELQPNNAASAGASSAAPIPYETVRKAVLTYQDAKGAHAASEVLKRFGAKYIMDLKAAPEKYVEVIEALRS